MNIERFDLRDIAAQPWKNGAGVTREIARGGIDAEQFDWRISLADVDRDAPFSAFPGIDRCIVLLQGSGMVLKSTDGSIDHALVGRLQPFHFAGDVPLDARLVDGPSRDFNVMVRRGVLRSEVACVTREAPIDPAHITLLMAVDGEWVVESEGEPQRLEPSQALLWREPPTSIKAWPAFLRTASSLLVVRLCHDAAP